MTATLFNVNNYVRVQLNEVGRRILRENHEALRRQVPTVFEYRPPEEDEDGWSKWQLWSLMSQFGPHIYLGCMLPFGGVIEINTEHLEKK